MPAAATTQTTSSAAQPTGGLTIGTTQAATKPAAAPTSGFSLGGSQSAGAVTKPSATATGIQLGTSASAPSNTLSLKLGGLLHTLSISVILSSGNV